MHSPTTAALLSIFLSAAAFAAPPATPVGAAMTANSPTSVTLSWFRPEVEDATSYNVYAADKADGPFAKLATVNDRAATINNLKPDSTRYYKVAAVNADGEGEPTKPFPAFTFKPIEPTPFPVKVANNLCVSLNSTILADQKPKRGKLESLVDGSDATGCHFKETVEIKIKLDEKLSIADAEYLLINFRTDCGGPYDFANDMFARTLRKYTIVESLDSTNGKDGTWTDVVSGTNKLLDGVIVFSNHKPKWIGVRSVGERELILCRLDVFRAPPAGLRNDYWIFTGDSLVVQDLPGGTYADRTAFFSDLIRKQYPGRYPIVVHHARGGEMMKDTLPRMRASFPELSPPNGTKTPTGTIVVWETGFNDVGLGASIASGGRFAKGLADAQALCTENGLVMVPVRIEFATPYLKLETLEPAKGTTFHNTLSANLAGVDVFARANTPYAVDPKTQLPYADYWTYTRTHHDTALAKDGVHHTHAGSDAINQLWADIAGKMAYGETHP